jgi:hypothetical protein
MAKVQVVGIRKETSAEAAQRAWFEQQVLAAPDQLEAAARLLIGLVTTLLGLLFGVLTIADDPLPAYLGLPLVRGLGIAVVVLLLVSLLLALIVVLPQRMQAASGMPASQQTAFKTMLRRKARALFSAAVVFGLGVLALGAILILALLWA